MRDNDGQASYLWPSVMPSLGLQASLVFVIRGVLYDVLKCHHYNGPGAVHHGICLSWPMGACKRFEQPTAELL